MTSPGVFGAYHPREIEVKALNDIKSDNSGSESEDFKKSCSSLRKLISQLSTDPDNAEQLRNTYHPKYAENLQEFQRSDFLSKFTRNSSRSVSTLPRGCKMGQHMSDQDQSSVSTQTMSTISMLSNVDIDGSTKEHSNSDTSIDSKASESVKTWYQSASLNGRQQLNSALNPSDTHLSNYQHHIPTSQQQQSMRCHHYRSGSLPASRRVRRSQSDALSSDYFTRSRSLSRKNSLPPLRSKQGRQPVGQLLEEGRQPAGSLGQTAGSLGQAPGRQQPNTEWRRIMDQKTRLEYLKRKLEIERRMLNACPDRWVFTVWK